MARSNAAYESESLVESLDYYPYGGQRIDSKTNYGGVRNKYAGTVYDALSGLNYMQARYQNSSRGQFISEDPVFLGDPSQQNLKDPQSLNSYSYANDNPITKSDPNGAWAIRFGVSGTIPGWALTGEIGIQTDFKGLEYYYGSGLAGGGGITVGPQFTTADLSHQYSVTTSAFAQGGVGLSVEVSKGMTYYPYSTRKPQPSQEATYGFPAADLAGGVMAEVSGPISFPAQRTQSTNYTLPKPQMVTSTNFYTQSNSVQANRGSSSMGSASYGQVLSNLQSAPQQLSVVLSNYKSSSAH